MSISSHAKKMIPMDWISAIYSFILLVLIALRHEYIGDDAIDYFLYLLLMFVSATIIFPLSDSVNHFLIKNPAVQFFRQIHPVIIMGFLFVMTYPISHMFFKEPLDQIFIDIDMFMFGFNPGLELAARWGNNYWFNEFMSFAYMSYYAIPWLAFYLFFKKEYKAVQYAGFIVFSTFYVCYILQSVFPVEGPIYHVQGLGHLVAGPISAGAASFLSGADVPGSAFPSAHVGGTVGIILTTWVYAKKAFWYTTPLWLALCFSTVYGHFHYVIDGIAGALLALLFNFIIAPYIFKKFFPDLIPDQAKKKVKSQEGC